MPFVIWLHTLLTGLAPVCDVVTCHSMPSAVWLVSNCRASWCKICSTGPPAVMTACLPCRRSAAGGAACCGGTDRPAVRTQPAVRCHSARADRGLPGAWGALRGPHHTGQVPSCNAAGTTRMAACRHQAVLNAIGTKCLGSAKTWSDDRPLEESGSHSPHVYETSDPLCPTSCHCLSWCGAHVHR